MENQEANVGDAGIAAAVFDHSGRPVGSLGVVGPADRLLARQAKASLSRAVAETARAGVAWWERATQPAACRTVTDQRAWLVLTTDAETPHGRLVGQRKRLVRSNGRRSLRTSSPHACPHFAQPGDPDAERPQARAHEER